MDNLIQFPIKPKEITLDERLKNCIINMKTNGKCECNVCKGKQQLVKRLVEVSKYLMLDYAEKNKVDLSYADWCQVVQTAAIWVEKEAYYPEN